MFSTISGLMNSQIFRKKNAQTEVTIFQKNPYFKKKKPNCFTLVDFFHIQNNNYNNRSNNIYLTGTGS